MSAPTATAHPYDHARRYPDGHGSIPVDWSDRLGENIDGWSARATEDVEGHSLVVDTWGSVFGAVVDGEFYDTEDVRDEARQERQAAEDAADEAAGDDLDAYVEPEPGPWQSLAETIEGADGNRGSFEGPMMNYFYLLERGGYGSRAIDLTQWAAKLDGLPLCAVELDGDYGLALTGGGMDLGWEVAEAHLRLGYRVPTWIDLPAMAQGGRLGKDFGGTAPLDTDDAAIVRAVIRDRRAEAERHTREADRLAERYGLPGAQA